ncbi:peptidylprolyl isomerase [Allohahella marinimesophila]|uniref:Peptidyl-prolyl cis-trans isomerase n=1 Tax=Allohahella marinimesophila TaxID=1054972 RepID=A0ABP7Q083_9GAMM
MISNNSVVEVSYRILDSEGELLDQTEDGEPMVYLHGHNNLMPALEKALDGKAAGDDVEITLQPSEAFGELQPDSVQRVSKKHFKQYGKLSVGDVIPLRTEDGQKIVTITKVGHSMVDVDTNHPYAGKTVQFKVKVLRERAATEEEVAHGHAHGFDGESGHHH